MKLKKILLIIMLMLCSTTIFACKQETISIGWSQTTIEMEKGEEKNISEIFSIENGNFSDVVFTSLNNSIVTVTNGKILAVNSGKAFVEAKINDEYAYLTVTVNQKLTQFSTVSNIVFDKNTNILSWDKAFKVVNNKPVFASSYSLSVTKNGTTTTYETNENFYEFTQSGNYSVHIVAKLSGYANSEKSRDVSFKILEVPTNLMFDKTTQVLSWQGNSNKYVVNVNGLELPQTANKSVQLSLTEVGSYTLSVKGVDEEFTSAKSDEITVTKLSIPSISVENGILKYDRTQQSLTLNYVISITPNLGSETLINSQTGSYTFPAFTGQFNVKVKAVGIENVLDSEYSQVITVTKLAKPVISFDLDTKKITSNVDEISLYIKNVASNSIKKVEFVNFEYTFNETAGIYEIYAVNENAGNNEINSDNSELINIKVLNAITNLRHEEDGNQSTLYFNKAEGCEGYRVYVDSVYVEGTYTTEPENKVVLDLPTDQLFNQGDKQVHIVGYDYSFSLNGANYFVVSENAVSDYITISRLETLTPELDDDKISWQEVSGALYYEYELYKDGTLQLSGQENTNVFSVEDLVFGNYTFKVKATGNQTTILSSLQFGEVTFSVKQPLQAPVVIFNHNTNSLEVTGVTNADSYVIEHNSNQLTVLSETLTYDISSLLTNAGVYQFDVFAQCITNDADNGGNLYKSEKTSIQIEKLSALSQISISDQEVISIDTSSYQGKISNKAYNVTINSREVNNLSNFEFDGSTFEVKVQMLADLTSTEPYFINSETSIFNFVKLDSVSNVEFNNYEISWDENQNAHNYRVKMYNAEETAFETTTDQIYFDIKQNATYLNKINSGESWNITVIACIDNQTILTGQTGYLNSEESNKNILKLETPTLDKFESQNEQDTIIKINWNDVLNATSYVLTYNSNDIDLLSSEYTANDLDQNSTYTYKIYALNPSYITSDALTVVLTRINGVNEINVSQDEKIDFEYNSNVQEIKINNTLATLPYDISSVTTAEQIFTIRLSGVAVHNTYYMASEETKFVFKD